MTRQRGWMLVGIVAAASVAAMAGGGLAQTAQPARRGPRVPTVAVVDVEKVFNGLKEKLSFEADFKDRLKKVQDEREKREKELRDLDDKLKLADASSPDYRQHQDELERKTLEFEAWGRFQRNTGARESRLQTVEFYDKIQKAIGKMAQAQGYDLVLFKESADLSGMARVEDPSGLIRGRKVLYAAGDLEITDGLIQSMNNEWQNRAGGAGTAPAR